MLYIISPPQIELEEFIPQLENALAKHKPAIFQLRLKNPVIASEHSERGNPGSHTTSWIASSQAPRNDEVIHAAKTLLPICHAHSVKFIINDSPELALQCNADGVHVGAEDMAVSAARALLGAKAIIGASCYNSIELARKAEAEGASYVSFGAFYPTTTKLAKSRAEIATLQEWKRISKTPCSAIGGIDFENKQPLENAGADYICMVSAIWKGH